MQQQPTTRRNQRLLEAAKRGEPWALDAIAIRAERRAVECLNPNACGMGWKLAFCQRCKLNTSE